MSKLKQLRTRCFFDISIAQDKIGRIIFELYNDVCPKTCENFKALCTGEKGFGKFTGKPLHYKNVIFHRVVKNFMVQCGDFSQGNGKGGESIYGGTFQDESFEFKHTQPFMLSMANRGKNTNGSQFFITLAPAPHLDGVHVVFGHVISGQDIVTQIGNQAVDKNSKPLVEISISNCGELIPQIKPKDDKKEKKSKTADSDESSSEDSSDSSSSDSDSDSSSSSEDSDSRSKRNKSEKASGPVAIPVSNLPNAPKVYANINPDEIPEVPANKFLSRSFKPKVKEESDQPNERSERSQDRREYSRKVSYSKSGRKIKGRGFLRFRTPSPRDDRYDRLRRSETPPHWKSEQAKLKTFKEVVSGAGETDKSHDYRRNRPSHDERYRRHRSRSRERYSHRSGRSEREHSSRRRSPDRERSPRKRSRSSSNDGDRDKKQKENLNGNSHSSNKYHRDRYNNGRSKHESERNSSPEQRDEDKSKRNIDKSPIQGESKHAIVTSP